MEQAANVERISGKPRRKARRCKEVVDPKRELVPLLEG
jgi:hypothetical protein